MSSVNNNFHIYICFGQSNMEGMDPIKIVDSSVTMRFQLLQSGANDISNPNVKGQWRTATPPLASYCADYSIADSFGKTLVEKTPEDITIGVIVVAIGGCDIRLFDKDLYTEHLHTYNEPWFFEKISWYDGNPYKHIIDLAKIAKQDGVIKGILLHQGETNTCESEIEQDKWLGYVDKIYSDMLSVLDLDANNVPLLAGEVVRSELQGICGGMNKTINKLPDVIKSAHVISAKDCNPADDNIHFNRAGVDLLGSRYAEKIFELHYSTK